MESKQRVNIAVSSITIERVRVTSSVEIKTRSFYWWNEIDIWSDVPKVIDLIDIHAFFVRPYTIWICVSSTQVRALILDFNIYLSLYRTKSQMKLHESNN